MQFSQQHLFSEKIKIGVGVRVNKIQRKYWWLLQICPYFAGCR